MKLCFILANFFFSHFFFLYGWITLLIFCALFFPPFVQLLYTYIVASTKGWKNELFCDGISQGMEETSLSIWLLYSSSLRSWTCPKSRLENIRVLSKFYFAKQATKQTNKMYQIYFGW